jgi:putative ABC transport system permease protein
MRALPSYSLTMLWRDRNRYLPAVLAVTFSAVLIAAQCGLLLGIVVYASLPIDRSRADIWVTTADAQSLSMVRAVPEAWSHRLSEQPEVDRMESYLVGAASWHKPGRGSTESCLLIGSRIDDQSLGAIREITPDLRSRLTEPGAVVVDEWNLGKLGLSKGADQSAEINGQRVRVVGTVHGYQGLTALYIFCSLETARMLLPATDERSEQTSYVLGRCPDPEAANRVVARLRARYPEMGVFTREEYGSRVERYWLFRTNFGTVMCFTVVLALLVGLVVTSQTLYAATLASLREYAVLDALGIPRWRLVGLVLWKSFWIGVIGVALAMPAIFALVACADAIRVQILLPNWVLLATAALTVGMALFSGLSALRSLRQLEPATLLR